MIPHRFCHPNAANYYLSFSDVKTPDLNEIFPHFPELLPPNREKGGKRGIIRAYFGGTLKTGIIPPGGIVLSSGELRV